MNKQDFVVVPYDPTAHKAALLEFLAQVYASDVLARRELVLDWIQEHHPLRDRAPLRFVIMDGPRVAATMGHLPGDFLVNGEPTPIRFTHDLLVDPTYRGKGLAKLIVGNSLLGGDFLPGGMWMTTPCFKIHCASGFDAARPLVTRTLVLNCDAFAKRKQLSGIKRWLGKTALNINRARALGRARSLSGDDRVGMATRLVDEFDPKMDGAWRGMLAGYGIGMVREARCLNWKYARHPILKYRIRIVERDGRPAGYIIARLCAESDEEKRAVITDFLVEKGDTNTLEHLLAHVVEEASASGMEALSALTTQSWAASVLRGFGFLPRGEAHTWVAGGWQGRIPAAWLTDHSPWHLCVGDSDGDLWSGSV